MAGIPTTGSTPFNDNTLFPDFSDVGSSLQENNIAAYNRLDPLFTLGLFPRSSQRESFHGLANRAVVVDLSQITSDEIKNTLAQLIVLSSHAYYNSQPHSGTIRQFLVFDEGHRVSYIQLHAPARTRVPCLRCRHNIVLAVPVRFSRRYIGINGHEDNSWQRPRYRQG